MVPSHLPEEHRAYFMTQKDGELRQRGLIVADSAKLVLRLLKASIPTVRIVCPETFFLEHEDLIRASGSPVSFLSESDVRQMTGHSIHKGVMAIAERPKDAALETLPDRILILNGVNNAENIGAVVRNALAFQFSGIIVDGESCSPWVRRALRVAMGSTFKLKIHHCQDIVEVLRDVQELDYKIACSEISSESTPIHQIEAEKRIALVLGSEGHGVSKAVGLQSQIRCFIPMSSDIDSLNVAVASGIMMHHFAAR